MASSAWTNERMSPVAAPALAQVQRAAPFLVFAVTAVLLWLMYGNRLILGTNDEGIVLDAAARILRGQKPYVDFFGYMSPGSFWAQALVFRLFGVTLAAGRLLVVIYLALECALVYWLVARLAARSAAIVTTLVFFAFQSSNTSLMTADHRWDSAALSLAAIALCTGTLLDSRPRWAAASGALIVLAAFATPSLALVAAATLGWMLWQNGTRDHARWYLVGMLAACCVLGAALSVEGLLVPLVRQMTWLSRNYSAVNIMPYGAIIGGYAMLFEGASAWEMPARTWIVVCVALPAVLPVLVVTGGALFLARPALPTPALRPALFYLMLSVAALAASTYPRADVEHLAYVSPLSYALAGILAYRCIPAESRAYLSLWLGVWGAIFLLQARSQWSGEIVQTPVGHARVSAEDTPVIRGLLGSVLPGQSLFVYPYKPLLYFLTQAENPTRYSYLAPGMMTPEDARLAVVELQRKPPDWVLYFDLAPEEFARVFPAAAGHSPHFPELESWLKANYVDAPLPPLQGYQLMQRAPGTR